VGAGTQSTANGGRALDDPATLRATRPGAAVGGVLAPITGLVSRLRHARMFHPDGAVYRATVAVAESAPPDLRRVGNRLTGAALVRFSSAWWRAPREWPDVLGMAVRWAPPDTQDLLLATIRFPWTTPFAPLATDVRSFLWNHYHAVSPFVIEPVGRVKLRMRSPRIRNRSGVPRLVHLAREIEAGRAIWTLEARRLAPSFFRRRWEPVAQLVLQRRVTIDQAALRFSPFITGRGLLPVGFVHGLRAATYAASQRARPATDADLAVSAAFDDASPLGSRGLRR
jgi:hypothetical protein